MRTVLTVGNTAFPNKQTKKFDEECEDEVRTPEQLFTQSINSVFDRIISEIEIRIQSSKIINTNFAFLNDSQLSQLTANNLEKICADLSFKYAQDLKAVDFKQELLVFKDQASIMFANFS